MKRRVLNIFRFFLFTLLAVGAFVLLLFVFQIKDPITEEDKIYAVKILADAHVTPPVGRLSYPEQIVFIQQVQKAVEHFGYSLHGIPYNHTRDLKDYYENPYGLCYDKSHAIEKILRVYNFQTRHISVYYYSNFLERVFCFFIPNSPSHAATEVKTARGWMYVDSIVGYTGLDSNGMPLNIKEVRKHIRDGKVTYEGLGLFDFSGEFTFLYGMYSRNGKLYPPYNFIPDYCFSELLYNLSNGEENF